MSTVRCLGIPKTVERPRVNISQYAVFIPHARPTLAVYPKRLPPDGGLVARRILQYGKDRSRLPTEGSIRQLTAVTDGGPQTAVVI
jgi:hypothetical protein